MHQESDGTVADDIERSGPASGIEAEAPLETVRLNPTHRTRDFSCAKSPRVTKFIREQAIRWVDRRYCGVFIYPNPDDPTEIWGYYTLSQYLLTRDEMDRKFRSRQLVQSIPLALIGFMGKQDGVPTGFGGILLTDAARRVYRHLDVPACGLALEPEGGKENTKLWNWYLSADFIPAKTKPGLMYGLYENLIPELTRTGA
jgi:hypothetical protein